MQGKNVSSTMPIPEARGAVHWLKFIVAEPAPVTVALPVAAAVALARMENPQMYVVCEVAADNVAVVAAVVPVAVAVIGTARGG
jgi:hypothetical protein